MIYPIQTSRGEERILPSWTLDIYNFFTKQPETANNGDFSSNLSGNYLVSHVLV